MQVTTVTFPHQAQLYILEDFLDTALAASIRTWFQHYSDNNSWQADSRFAHRPGRLVYQQPEDLLAQAQAQANRSEFRCQLKQWTGHDLSCQQVEAWVDLPGYQIDPHVDFMNPGQEFYGLQVFFTTRLAAALGTAFYTSAHPVINLPLRHNLAYFVARGDRLVHGLIEPVPSQQQRYSIHFKYRTAA
jgi:hypothetical protein